MNHDSGEVCNANVILILVKMSGIVDVKKHSAMHYQFLLMVMT